MFGYPATATANDITGTIATTKPAEKAAQEKAEAAKPTAEAKEPPPDKGGIVVALDQQRGPSPGERALLERLQEGRAELDARARELDMREGMLKAAEKKIQTDAATKLAEGGPRRDVPDALCIEPRGRDLHGGCILAIELARTKRAPCGGPGHRLAPGELGSFEELSRGHGAIVRDGLGKVAAYRDENGRLIKRSAACTHLGCHLHWNSFERCWDCPCHGSHFAIDGTVLNGPAVSPLAVK